MNTIDEARNEDNKPFIKDVPDHPHGSNFYPEDMSKGEFEEWLSTLSKDEKEQAEGYYSHPPSGRQINQHPLLNRIQTSPRNRL